MSNTWYRFNIYSEVVKEQKVIRESKASIFFDNGFHERKETTTHIWYKTRKEAVNRYVQYYKSKIHYHKKQIQRFKTNMQLFKSKEGIE